MSGSLLNKNPFEAYKTAATTTATPGQLVLMLYDGVIRFVQQAIISFDITDPAEMNSSVNTNLVKAQNIIFELANSLDHTKGGNVAENFLRIYDYCDRRIHTANMEKSSEGLDEVINHFVGLRDAWSTMLERGGSPMSENEFETWQSEAEPNNQSS